MQNTKKRLTHDEMLAGLDDLSDKMDDLDRRLDKMSDWLKQNKQRRLRANKYQTFKDLLPDYDADNLEIYTRNLDRIVKDYDIKELKDISWAFLSDMVGKINRLSADFDEESTDDLAYLDKFRHTSLLRLMVEYLHVVRRLSNEKKRLD